MGGKGSGRPRSKSYGDFTLETTGKQKLVNSRRFKTFAYKQNEEKFYGMKDKFTNTTYKRMNQQTWDYTLRRFGTEEVDKVLSRMDIYSGKGIVDRAEIARGNIISALNNVYNINKTFVVNGKEYTLKQIIDKIEDLQYTEKWIDFANKYSNIIDSFFVGYRAEVGTPPPKDAGLSDKNSTQDEQDHESSDNYDKMFSLIEDLVKTFRL